MSIFSNTQGCIEYRRFGERILIEPYGPNALRVRATLNSDFAEISPALLPAPAASVQVTSDDKCASIANGKIRCSIDAAGRIRFETADGKPLLNEVMFHRDYATFPHSRQYDALDGGLHHITVRFESNEGERFYGMGQRTHGLLDQKGCVLELAHRNTQSSIPFLLSSRGYGFVWNNPAIGRAELGRNMTSWVAQASKQIDYVVIAGQSSQEILGTYTAMTGRSPMIPEWALGFWQCKLRYKTQAELLEVARRHKKMGLPMSVIVIDFFHWPALGEWKFDSEYWPDPDAMVRELHEMGIKLMVSVWPAVAPWSSTYKQMSEQGMLLRTNSGQHGLMGIGDTRQKLNGAVAFYDPTNPEAREFVWDRIREGYLRHGIDAYWLDACEPEMIPFQPQNVRLYAGPALEVGNLYPLRHQQMAFEGLQKEGHEVLTLSRCAWLGSQRYGAALWNGDIQSTWACLRASVPEGLNAMLSGVAWWTTDIGGFTGGNGDDEGFRELLVRWFEYGVFCPLFRLHGARDPISEDPLACLGTGGPNELWSYGPRVYEKIAPLLFLRERLRDYIRLQMQKTHEDGVPSMRPLFFDFQSDAQCAAIEDQFMFGPSIMVAPVTTPGAATREVYLPAGCTWTHAWTGQSYPGGQRVTVPAPLGQGPVFLRNKDLDAKLFANLPCPAMA